MFGLTGALKAFNSYEDLLDGFCAVLKVKDHFVWNALEIPFFFYVAPTKMHVFTHNELS